MFKLRKHQKGFTVLEVILLIVIVGMICGVIGYVISNMSKKNDNSESRSTTSSQVDQKKDSSSTKKEEAQLPELVTYGDAGIRITSESDVSKLTDASESFKSFVKDEIKKNGGTPDPEVCDQPYTIVVRTIYKDTFAKGGTGNCGGAAIIWKKDGGKWSKVWGGQMGITCSEVTKFSIPSQVEPECLDDTTYEPQKNTL